MTVNLEEKKKKKPEVYQSSDALQKLYEKIAQREPFSYDPTQSPLYEQYQQQYTQAGRAAMADTMGQAAALTGGYSSTYSQNLGQQAYNAYLRELNAMIPELYAQAREDYDRQGQWLLDLYGLQASRDSTAYARWQDAYERWLQEYAMGQEQANWQAEMDLQKEKWAYQKARDQAGAASSGSSGSGSGGSAAKTEGEEPEKQTGDRGQHYGDGIYESHLQELAATYRARGGKQPLEQWVRTLGLTPQAEARLREILRGEG